MTKTTNEPNEIICECGHTERDHIVDGCVILDENGEYMCDCTLGRTDVLRSRLSTLEAAVEERDGMIKKLREFISNNQYISEFDLTSSFSGDTCDCFACKAEKILNETAPKVQS